MIGDAPQRTLSEKINYLFEMVRADDGGRLTSKEAVARIREAGTEISESHLSELRRGVKTNPTIRVLEALAGVFRIPVAYFFQDDRDVVALVDSELELREAMREAKVADIAHRAHSDLSPQQQTELNRVLAQIIRDNMLRPAE
ncbi:XRE family transcriptional regulator [Pseudonocardia sp. RS010]|uniref:XRE family transcriptional regulator n=1 Tax=Pseudonocardia sp. RS010 TaxID=3385979 RepID=UPI0039A3BF7B